ncbi:hypothetical protein ASPWEDRAFT_172691 [Aspergillus wentii DTO 134E9]|uniref:Uncharacterized protein n=1 Tax=Aspergillus wentii DTO 134E9 TaxID=1073089 RepID=A0A1L9RLY2_ASPWE|nr:uncharacterized protein ASPWEDRAFT_172691 [Aspergillus wentii DTO 134E9]KAI9929646.1 hypothetical protein MW887_001120 [Aspergillus wentii]OJJ35904.1 hypothetical protein ASPWEDRAFT_172691 [Aspergillus wentii DTO 134E9]
MTLDWIRNRVWRPPVKPQVNRYYEECQRLRRRLDVKEHDLNELRLDNQQLKHKAQDLRQQHISDSERIRRLNDLLAESRDHASEAARKHGEEIKHLYNTIHSLHGDHENVDDEKIIDEIRKLGQSVQHWVKAHFKDAGRLAALIPESPDGFPKTSHQRRAYIQAAVSDMILQHIFVPYYPGLGDNPWGRSLQFLESGVDHGCPERILQSWRTGTYTFIYHAAQGNRENVMRNIVGYVEGLYGHCSSTETAPRVRQLQKILQGCFELKSLLCR